MPAPPLESDDAMLSTRAIRVTSTPYAGMTQIRFAGVISAPRGAPRYEESTTVDRADAAGIAGIR
jgi:hypothetical protein